MDINNDAIILFWGALLSPVLHKPPEEHRSDRQIMQSLCEKEYIYPDGYYRRFSLSTFQRKLKNFRKNGLEGLRQKLRSDEGGIRGSRNASRERAFELKRENPFRSDLQINLILRS